MKPLPYRPSWKRSQGVTLCQADKHCKMPNLVLCKCKQLHDWHLTEIAAWKICHQPHNPLFQHAENMQAVNCPIPWWRSLGSSILVMVPIAFLWIHEYFVQQGKSHSSLDWQKQEVQIIYRRFFDCIINSNLWSLILEKKMIDSVFMVYFPVLSPL